MKIMAVIPIGLAVALLCPLGKAQTANIEELLGKAAQWNYDQNREPMRAVSDAVESAKTPAAQREMEKHLDAFLGSGATLASKDFVCRQLSMIGSEASVPVLSGMLAEASTADMARFALERIPGPAVDRAVREALTKTSGRTQIGVINTIGRRRDAGSVAALAPLATGSDPAVAAAAQAALGEIANPAAVRALDEAFTKTSGSAHVPAAEAYLKAADNLVARGSKSAAVPIYRKVYAAGQPPVVRAGALQGLAVADPAATPVLLAALRGDDLRLQSVAIRLLARTSAKQLLAETPKLSETGRIRVLAALAEQRDKAALPAFTSALKDSSKPVRVEALEGIGVVGDASSVSLLAAAAASDDDAERAAARTSLARIAGKDVDQKIVADLSTAQPKERVELIRAVGVRGTPTAAPVLLKMARDTNGDVRIESLKALRSTASSSDIPGLVALVVGPIPAGDRTEAARSLASVLRRSDSAHIGDVVSAYKGASNMEARAALLSVLGQTGDPQALDLLRNGLKEQDPDLRRASILALTEWPDGTPIPDLSQFARSASAPAQQVLALRAILHLVVLPVPHRSPQESVKVLADVMSMAQQPEEKRAVLGLLPKFPVREALDLANASVKDSQVGSEAQNAVSRLERTVRNR